MGVVNVERAAAKISGDQTADVIREQYLADGETYTRYITTNGTSLIGVTIVWVDAGTPPAASLDPSDIMLVNDLDLKIIQYTNTYYPWKVNKNNTCKRAY